MYTTRAKIEAMIRQATLAEMLDDNRDGAEDAGLLDAIMAAACQMVDSALGAAQAAIAASASPVPAPVAEAATLAACYMLYRRLPTKDADNPFTDTANAAMERCRAIARGEVALASSVAGSGTIGDVGLRFDDAGQDGI